MKNMSKNNRKKKNNKIVEQRRKEVKIKKLKERIMKWDAPSLHQLCDPVVPGEDLGFITDMIDILHATEDGVGLAAPQINVCKRVVVVWSNRGLFSEPKVLVNPRVVSRSSRSNKGQEGCLSFPGVYTEISRPSQVVVEYSDQKFNKKTWDAKAFAARVICHEIDHINGICLVGEHWKKINANH